MAGIAHVTVIADAGPLMALGKLNRLDLLAALYPKVMMPTAVYDEVVRQGLTRGEPDAARVKRFWQRQAWPSYSHRREILGDSRVLNSPGTW